MQITYEDHDKLRIIAQQSTERLLNMHSQNTQLPQQQSNSASSLKLKVVPYLWIPGIISQIAILWYDANVFILFFIWEVQELYNFQSPMQNSAV